MPTDLIQRTDAGLYCADGDFYIDPWSPVERAVITHAHSDHARPGSSVYFSSREGASLLKMRIGGEAQVEPLDFGESIEFGGVRVSLHSAGHIRGSAQIRVERDGEVAVVSGDFKRATDPTTTPFEQTTCQLFITESTFALPIYRWPAEEEVMQEIRQWWLDNQQRGVASLLFAYSLGKSQRILASLGDLPGPVYTHGAVERFCQAYREDGVEMPLTTLAVDAPPKTDFSSALIVAPPSARGTPWIRRFGKTATAIASGWMRVRGMRRRRAVDRGFVLSDHADWRDLVEVIQATGAKRVLTTHGYADVLARWLHEQGVEAGGLDTPFTGEQLDAEPEDTEPDSQQSDRSQPESVEGEDG